MFPRDRFLASVHLEEPDVVPIYEIDVSEHIVEEILQKKISSPRRAETLRKISEGTTDERRCFFEYQKDYMDAMQRIGMDAFPARLSPGCGPPSIEWLDENTWKSGFIVRRFTPEGDPSWYVRGTFRGEMDFDKLKSDLDPIAGSTDGVREAVKTASKLNIATVGMVGTCFTSMCLIWGMDNALASFYKDPGLTEKILEAYSTHNIETAKQMIDCGVDAIWIGDDLAYQSGTFVSPLLFRKFLLPHYKRLFETVKRRGLTVHFHSDGRTYTLLDDLVSIGLNGLQAIEPEAGMDIGLLKERYGNRLSFMGNVSCGYTLSLAKKEEVLKETRDVITKVAPGGGLIMGSSNSVHYRVKFENFLAMIKTTKKYGIYKRGEDRISSVYMISSC